MNHLGFIESVIDELLLEEIRYSNLKEKLDLLETLLKGLSGLNTEASDIRENIKHKNGEALSPFFASLCITDIIRTRQFIRGAYFAIKDLLAKQEGPIRILYAGTVPYATLVLPILTKFRPDQVQLTLLELMI